MQLKQAKQLKKDDEVQIKETGEVGRVYCVQEINEKLLWVSVVLPDGADAVVCHRGVRHA